MSRRLFAASSMTDQETGSGFTMGADDSRYDAVNRLRRRWEEAKAAETGPETTPAGPSNVVRLPRRPRRGREDGDARPQPWMPEGVHDPAPTRPVTRAELQGESGSWLVNPPEWAAAPAAETADQENNVLDLSASRRKRAGAEGAPARTRPKVMPRRVGPGEHKPGGDAKA